jgi:hypothetical protein
MKKVMKCLGVMALVALAFTSCKKAETKSSITVASEDLITVDMDEDRAFLDDASNHTFFEIGDRVMVFNISKTTPTMSNCGVYECINQGSNVQFVNSGYGDAAQDALDGGYYAYYPFVEPFENIISELPDGENKSKFHVQAEQTYRADKVSLGDLYMAGYSDAPNLDAAVANFQMQNIMGVLRLLPYENAQRTVTKIQVVDNRFHLSGWVELIIPEVNATELKSTFNLYNPADPDNATFVSKVNEIKNRMGYNVTDGGYSITLNVPDGVQLGATKATTTAFNIVLRPLAMSQGFHIIFTFDDGTTKDVDASANHNFCIKPNTRLNLGLNMDNYPG